MKDQNVQGLIVDHESMVTFAGMSKEDFSEFAKPRFYVNQSESTQKKWIAELHKIAVGIVKPATKK